MEFSAKSVPLFLLFCVVALPAASGQEERGTSQGTKRVTRGDANLQQRSNRVRTLTRAEGLEIVSVATDSRPHVRSRYDCSHFVHGLYQRAGFPYVYASSSELYSGVAQFRRVESPQPGDLAVWPGHAGIVVNPAKHSFLSVLHSGPGVNRYDSPYWKHRGRPRFFRYVKGAPGEVFSSSLRNAGVDREHQ
jgi:cell wall-associated NlpC family hydrolase